MGIGYERYARAAQQAGCSRSQLENFLRMGAVLQPRQLMASALARRMDQPDGPDELGYGGARGGGKSHWGVVQLADDCLRYPGLKCLLLRKVGKSGKENFRDLLPKAIPRIYTYSAWWSKVDSTLYFANGSRVLVGHFQNEGDIDSYLGLEYDCILVEEATTLTFPKYRDIRTCCRTSKPGWRVRMYSTTNPGNVGHAWYKRRFITDPGPYRQFIPATVRDNQFVHRDYRRQLDELTGWRLRAWRDGDWDIAAGQFFTTFRRETHIVKPFESIPSNWPMWAAMDYGFTHPQAMYLFASGDGAIYHVAEYVSAGRLVQDHAAEFKAMVERYGRTVEQLTHRVAGTDIFAKKDDGATIAQKYATEGIIWTPANTDRINGAGEYLQRLGDVDRNIAPRMFFSSNCVRLIDCIPSLQHDPHRPEDVLKVDVDDEGNGGDDPYDASRYGLMAVWTPNRTASSQSMNLWSRR